MRLLRNLGVAVVLLASGCATTNLDIADSCIDRWNEDPPLLGSAWAPEYALVSVSTELGYDSCSLHLVSPGDEFDCYLVRPGSYINSIPCADELPDPEGGVLTRYVMVDGDLSR